MKAQRFVIVVCLATSFACPLLAQVQGAWANTGAIPTALWENVQVPLGNGKVLIAGGTDGTNYLTAAQLYNPTTGTWTATGSLPSGTGRAQFAAVVLPSGKVLVEGGVGAGSTIFARADLYDPSHGTWSAAGQMSVARYGHTATLVNGKVMVTGGCVSNGCTSVTGVTEIYNPATNTWTTGSHSLNTARAYQTATLLGNGKVLVVSGSNGAALQSSELYDPNATTWTNGPNTSIQRLHHSATLLANGKVLVAGGGLYVNQADLYDPTLNTFTPTGPLKTALSGHTATALPNNTVLISGGYVRVGCGKYSCPAPTNQSEVYDVAAATFSCTPHLNCSGNLNVARAAHTATLLPSNDVLVVGGCAVRYCTTLTAASEIYTPLTLSISAYSLNFGLQQTTVPSPAQTVTVTNVSHGPVTFPVNAIAASGDYHIQTNTCQPTPAMPATLASGNNCTITVNFKPVATGTRTGALTLRDNSTGSPIQKIALTGTGEPYAITVTPNPLNLPSVIPGSSTTATATVTNDGGAPVNITSISVTPADRTFTVYSTNCPSTLALQQTCQVVVLFTPPDSIPFTATLQVFDNAPGSPHVATLTGTGID